MYRVFSVAMLVLVQSPNMSERMCEATSKQGTVAVDIESSSDDGIEGTTGTEFKQRPTVAVDIESSSDDGVEGTTGTEFKQRPSCFRSKERRDSPHSKRVSFGADEKGDAEILVQPKRKQRTQDAYGQYCGIPAPQRYGFLSKAKQGRQLAPALVDGRNSREEEESSGAFRRVVATPGPQRVLARTASCPADMSPEGTERFENTCRLQELRRGELCLPWREAAALIKPQAPTKRPAATGASQAPRRCKLRPRGAPRDFTTL